jgi:hypothetical protein
VVVTGGGFLLWPPLPTGKPISLPLVLLHWLQTNMSALAPPKKKLQQKGMNGYGCEFFIKPFIMGQQLCKQKYA